MDPSKISNGIKLDSVSFFSKVIKISLMFSAQDYDMPMPPNKIASSEPLPVRTNASSGPVNKPPGQVQQPSQGPWAPSSNLSSQGDEKFSKMAKNLCILQVCHRKSKE